MDILKQVIGTFNGENVDGEDGLTYTVPGNYASKSKLIEGDTMKALVQQDGSIVFKQLRTVPRERFIGTFTRDGKIEYEGQEFKVIGASIRYYKLRVGTKVACITSQGSQWCAVESVIEETN